MAYELLRVAILRAIERFEHEYQELTDGQFGSVEQFPEVARLRVLTAKVEPDANRCIRHDTWPEDDEPCWACVNEFLNRDELNGAIKSNH